MVYYLLAPYSTKHDNNIQSVKFTKMMVLIKITETKLLFTSFRMFTRFLAHFAEFMISVSDTG